MNSVFTDASFWIGLRDTKDQFHRDALKATRYFMENRFHLVLTPLVFAEVHAQFSRARITSAKVIADCWDNPVVKIERPSVADEEQGIEILRANRDKSYSFCDAVSFAVMLRLGINRVVTFDHHFRQFGQFTVIDGRNL